MAQKNLAQKIASDQIKDTPKAILENLFEDYYKYRRQLYVMNLVRGIFFGFGSVVGGTIVVALLLWLLSVLHYFPFLEQLTEAVQSSLESRQ